MRTAIFNCNYSISSPATCHVRMQKPETTTTEVIEKAKKSARHLWILLHAKYCTDSFCKVASCGETKAIYQSSRDAVAGLEIPTKDQVAKILQAQKLLRHYQACRSARAENKPRLCLLCSLVGRCRMVEDQTLPAITLSFSSSPYDVRTNRMIIEFFL